MINKIKNNIIVLALLIITTSCSMGEPDWPDSSEIKSDPEQYNYNKNDSFNISKDGFILKVKAEYEIDARVLGVEYYNFGETAKIIPLDLALGWRAMSTTPTISALNIRQGQRRYYYSWFGKAPPRSIEIPETSANTHIIPASEQISDILKFVDKNDRVVLEGYLVDVYFPNGGIIKTSMTRKDTWDGACEVMYVTNVKILTPP